MPQVRTCRECRCTDDDCRQCIEKTGQPCYWVAEDLCSACATPEQQAKAIVALQIDKKRKQPEYSKPLNGKKIIYKQPWD